MKHKHIPESGQAYSKGVDVGDVCVFCNEEGEMADQLLIQCVEVKRIWDILFSSFNLAWKALTNVKEVLTKVFFRDPLISKGK